MEDGIKFSQSPAQRQAVLDYFSAIERALTPAEPRAHRPARLSGVIEGREAIFDAACDLLRGEVDHSSRPCIRVMLATPSLLDADFLPALLREVCTGKPRLRVIQLLQLPPELELNDENASELLQPIALICSLFCFAQIDYEPYVLDVNTPPHSHQGIIYSNYLLFNDCALLISANAETALVLSGEGITTAYRSYFDRGIEHSRSTSRAIPLEHVPPQDFNEEDDPYFSLTYSPVLFHQYDRAFLEKYIRPETPNWAAFIQQNLDFHIDCTNMTQNSAEISYFTEDGLMRFAAEGTSSEMPPETIRPIDREDRAGLLPDLRRQRFARHLILDPERFRFPGPFSLYVSRFSVVLYDRHHFGSTASCVIQDARVVRLMRDFFNDLRYTDCVYPATHRRKLWKKARELCKADELYKADEEEINEE